jgi:signal transduction histidine kinase
MIEDLVDSARSDSHQLRLRLAPVDVGEHLSELLGRSASLLDIRRIRVAVLPGRPLVARADPNRLDRIVLNLRDDVPRRPPRV